MRYHYEKPMLYSSLYGRIYSCDHPVYNRCTLFEISGQGVAVIQQRYNFESKSTSWCEVDPWLIDSLYLHPDFKNFFDKRSRVCVEGLYPTVTVRQMMWALKMKPLKKERWETVFDRKYI